MLKTQEDVLKMMRALGIPLPNKSPRADNIRFELLRSLVKEEAQEFEDAMVALALCTGRPKHWRKAAMRWVKPDDVERAKAMNDEDFTLHWWSEAIDAIVDTIVVLHNTTNAMGIDLEPFWDEVQRANMAKAGGPTREDGKKLKPEGWEPPKMRALLEATLKKAKFEPCSPSCRGLDIFEIGGFEPPEGWVHIERCDECDLYESDQAAAESISDNVGFVCRECPPTGKFNVDKPVMTEEEANAHEHEIFRVVVPKLDAASRGFFRQAKLSANQALFCKDAFEQGFNVRFDYNARGVPGASLAIQVDCAADLETAARTFHDVYNTGTVIYVRN